MVELNSLVETRSRLPSVNEVDREEEGWAIVQKFREKTPWMRGKINYRVGKDI